MGYRKFAKDRHRPEGKWVQATPLLHVAGLIFRNRSVKAFARAADRAERSGTTYGLALEWQPNNPHDPNALAVYGVAEVRGLFRRSKKEWHVGFLPAEVAEECVRDFLVKEVPLGIELYQIGEGVGDYFEVQCFVLAPPGNSASTRERARR